MKKPKKLPTKKKASPAVALQRMVRWLNNNIKPYKAKSLKGAQTRVRQLQKQVSTCHEIMNRFACEKVALAKLAAETPQFSNPLDVMEAEKIRDRILKAI